MLSQSNIADMGPRVNEIVNTLSADSIFNTLSNGTAIDITIGLMLIFPYILWLFSYQMGLFLNLRYSEIVFKKRIHALADVDSFLSDWFSRNIPRFLCNARILL